MKDNGRCDPCVLRIPCFFRSFFFLRSPFDHRPAALGIEVHPEVTEFNYYLQLDPMIAEMGQMSNLESFGQSGLLSGLKTIVFVDNHDTQRSQELSPRVCVCVFDVWVVFPIP